MDKVYLTCFNVLFLGSTLFGQVFNEISSNGIVKVRYGDAELVDIDNDGDDDLIVSGLVSTNNSVTYTYKNNGNGQFSIFQSSGLPTVGFSSIATGDIDNDGDADLFVTGYWSWSGHYSELFRNNGTGSFSSVSAYFPGVSVGESEFFDADNDGDLDLFYFGRTSQTNQISKLFFNDGLGNFTESTQSFPPNHKGSLDIGDANQDGYLDILMSGESGSISGTTQLLINQGDGTFLDDGQSYEQISLGSARFIDLEPDGDLDIVANGITNGALSFHSVFYENNGLGTYTNIGNLGLDSLLGNSLIVSDIDLDGDQDIFLSGRNSDDLDTCAVYLNENTVFVKETSFSHQGLFDGAAVFGYVNNDCGIDHFYCGYGDVCLNESYLFLNTTNSPSNCPPEDSGNSSPIFDSSVFPNVFTPNGDGLNDYLEFQLPNEYDKIKFHVLNRWGKIVYYTNSSLILWDGLSTKGEKLKDGTYFWELEYIDLDDKSHRKSGFVNLLSL